TIDREGRERTFAYDGLGRMISESWYNWNPVTFEYDYAKEKLGYGYDAADNLLLSYESKEADGSGMFADTKLTRTHDVLNRVTRAVDGFGGTLSYQYDAAGRSTIIS